MQSPVLIYYSKCCLSLHIMTTLQNLFWAEVMCTLTIIFSFLMKYVKVTENRNIIVSCKIGGKGIMTNTSVTNDHTCSMWLTAYEINKLGPIDVSPKNNHSCTYALNCRAVKTTSITLSSWDER